MIERTALTEAQAAILTRMAGGATLTHSLVGDRLWSLLEDPFTVFDDVSPRVLLAAGYIALAQRGSLKADRADVYRLTTAGHAMLRDWRLRQLRKKEAATRRRGRPKSREERPKGRGFTKHDACRAR